MNESHIQACKKCGSSKHTTKYIAPEPVYTYRCGEMEEGSTDDYLKVTCQECGYTWEVDTLDKKELE